MKKNLALTVFLGLLQDHYSPPRESMSPCGHGWVEDNGSGSLHTLNCSPVVTGSTQGSGSTSNLL